jgi:hypothetical protein
MISGTYQIRKSVIVIFAGLGLALLTLDAALVKQDRSLKLALEAQVPSLAVQVGAQVPGIQGIDPTGNDVIVTYGADPRETLLFVFSTECGICAKNWPTWESMAKHIDHTSFRVVYANLSKGVNHDYLVDHGLTGSEVVAQVDPKSAVAYGLSLTPQVQLISSTGKVEHVWLGMLKSGELSNLESALKLSAKDIAAR